MSLSTLPVRTEAVHWFVQPEDSNDCSGVLSIGGELWTWNWLHGECNGVPVLAGMVLESPAGDVVQCQFLASGLLFCERSEFLSVFRQALALLQE